MRFERPVEGSVWLDGGPRVPAKVVGEWNGWAIADVAADDVPRLLGSEDTHVSRQGEVFIVTALSMGETWRLPIDRGRVVLGEGWSLNWKPGRAKARRRR